MTVQVPLATTILSWTFPPDIATLKSTAAVLPFKSGVELSVQTAVVLSHVDIINPVLVELSDGLTK